MPEDAAFCAECGYSLRPMERAHGLVGVLPETFAGALAYFLLPAIAFLLIEPYNKNRFVRFHAFQCIGAWIAAVIVAALLRIASVVFVFIPMIGQLAVWLTALFASLALVIVWIVLVVKALQGETFKLPWIGDFAELQSGKT